MKIYFLFFILFPFCIFAKDCENELERYFSTSAGDASAKEYLRLRADLAFHRVAHALFLNNRVSPNNILNVEVAIAQAIDRMKLSEMMDPEFKKAKKSFEEYPLSRKEFSQILPFVSSILNQNLELKGESKTLYSIDDHDLKIFHLLGSIEDSLDPINPTSFGNDRSQDNSVLSFPKLVNSVLKKKKETPFSSEKLEKRLITSTRKLRSLIKEIEEETDCILMCPGEGRPRDSLFSFIDDFKSDGHLSLPYLACAYPKPATVPGTPLA